MRADGCNVLVEGREQTLNHVRAAFKLATSSPVFEVAAGSAGG